MPVAKVTVDFARRQDPPLVKKFGVMNSGILRMRRYRRDLPKLRLLHPCSLRIDLSIGKKVGWRRQIIGGTRRHPRYNWKQIDWLARQLDAREIAPMWGLCYLPLSLQPRPPRRGAWRGAPTDLALWQRMARRFSRHFRKRGIAIGYYEVWNEPDFPMFFSGTRADYFRLYAAAAKGIKQGDPHAAVGGPALAYSFDWVKPFLEYVLRHKLPLNFFSFHSIGGGAKDIRKERFAMLMLHTIRAAMGRHRTFDQTPIYLDEYNPYKGRKIQHYATYRGAARLLHDFALFLPQNDLTMVNWAQFMHAGPHGVDLLRSSGRAIPAYGAFAIYADMPARRVAAIAPKPLEVLASANRRRAGVVIWNSGSGAREIILRLRHEPIVRGEMETFRIDREHNAVRLDHSAYRLTPLKEVPLAGTSPGRIRLSLPAHGTIYLRVVRKRPARSKIRGGLAASIVRVRHFFPQRPAAAYGYVDRRRQILYAGMGAKSRGLAMVEATVQLKKGCDAVRLRIDRGKTPTPDGVEAVRVDFPAAAQRPAVTYCRGSRTLLTHLSIPWAAGNRRAGVQHLRRWLRVGWKARGAHSRRRLRITAVLQNAGAGRRMRVRVESNFGATRPQK